MASRGRRVSTSCSGQSQRHVSDRQSTGSKSDNKQRKRQDQDRTAQRISEDSDSEHEVFMTQPYVEQSSQQVKKASSNHTRAITDAGNDNSSRKGGPVNSGGCECPDCESEVMDGDRAAECEVCLQWYHAECQRISSNVYAVLTEDTSNQISWYCSHCKKGAKVLMGHIKILNEQQHRLDARLVTVERRVGRLEELATGDPMPAAPMTLDKELRDFVDDRVEEGINEYREREARKTNVIIHNIPESSKETPAERKEEDATYVKNIAAQINVPDIDIKAVIRLGKKTNKPRLTKIQFSTVSQKRSILQNARQLKEAGNDEMERIFITPDQSVKARQLNKQLRKELTERLEAGEENIVIRKGKIVELLKNSTHTQDPFRRSGQRDDPKE